MSRPKHLSCINTAEGIRRINEEQALYDRDPEAFERNEREYEEQRSMEEEAERLEETRRG